MSDLITRAQAFATQAHQRIDQRRKYSGQPYDVHLAAVAAIVARVADDPEMVAAAWLHDVVEDTPVTLEELGRQFGEPVQRLVEQLTDVSLSSQGNRAARKAIDRRHTAAASARAKTIKLADLIDNCEDITHHDPRFARVFLQEMDALLAVLVDGDAGLWRRAQALHADSLRRLQAPRPGPATPLPADQPPTEAMAGLMPQLSGPRIVRLFRETFTAGDVLDRLFSFDADHPQAEVVRAMAAHQQGIAGLRIDGAVQGFVRVASLDAASTAPCRPLMQPLAAGQLLDAQAPLIDVVGVLRRHELCFVTSFDARVGVVERDAVNKPVVRMWLFGALTLYEMGLVQLIEQWFPDDAWHAVVPPARLDKARELQAERQRRQRHSRLIDCLQFGDKARLMLEHPLGLAAMDQTSKRAAKQAVKDLESLRNHLVHAQDIVSHDWMQIIRITQRVAALGGE